MTIHDDLEALVPQRSRGSLSPDLKRLRETPVAIAPADGHWWVRCYRPGDEEPYLRNRVAAFVANALGTVRSFVADPTFFEEDIGPTYEGELIHDDDFEHCVCGRPSRDHLGFCSRCGGVDRP